MKFDLLKYPTLVGQVSEVPMSSTSLKQNYTEIISTAFDQLYIITTDWDNSPKIEKLTF